LRKFIGVFMLTLAVSAVAQAHGTSDFGGLHGLIGFLQGLFPPHTWNHSAISAPEIDPAGMVMGLTLLAGSLAVLRGRRIKK